VRTSEERIARRKRWLLRSGGRRGTGKRGAEEEGCEIEKREGWLDRIDDKLANRTIHSAPIGGSMGAKASAPKKIPDPCSERGGPLRMGRKGYKKAPSWNRTIRDERDKGGRKKGLLAPGDFWF